MQEEQLSEGDININIVLERPSIGHDGQGNNNFHEIPISNPPSDRKDPFDSVSVDN